MVNDIWSSLTANPVIAFFLAHLEIVVVLGICLFAIWYFARHFSKKGKPKVISRKLIEKQNRIEALKYNKRNWILRKSVPIIDKKTGYPVLDENGKMILKEDIFYPEIRKLWHGSKLIGNVQNIHHREEENSDKRVVEIVFKPIWFSTYSNPFSDKKDVIRIYESEIEKINENQNFVEIKPDTSLDAIQGMNYDVPHESEHRNWVKNNMFKTDFEELGSEYYTESQKRSVIPIEVGAEAMLKEKELQIELAKKRGKQTSI